MRGAAFPTNMDRYIARLMAKPLAIVLALSAMILLLDKLRRLLDFVVNEGGSPRIVFSLLANIAPTYISFGVVLGSLLSVVLAFRKLAMSAELDVLRASGVSYARMLAMPFCFAIVLAAVNFLLIGFAQPHARYAYKQIEFDLQSGALGMTIRPGEFNRIGKASTLWIGKISDGRLDDVFIRTSGGQHSLTISAAHARVLEAPERDVLLFRLGRGVLVEQNENFSVPRILSFTSYDMRVPLPKTVGGLGRGSDADELTIPELARLAKMPTDGPVEQTVAAANFHFRLVQVATLLVLPMLGLALAVPPKRTESGVGIFASVVLLVLWYKVDQYALMRAAAGGLNPVIGLWGTFAIFAALSAYLYDRFAHRIGSRPLGAIEAGWARIRDAWRP